MLVVEGLLILLQSTLKSKMFIINHIFKLISTLESQIVQHWITSYELQTQLSVLIIYAFDPLLSKIENDKNFKRTMRGRKLCNFKSILRRDRYSVLRDI